MPLRCQYCRREFLGAVPEMEVDEFGMPLVLQCGHLFHSSCLDTALSEPTHEKVVEEGECRFTCPVVSCKSIVHNENTIKISVPSEDIHVVIDEYAYLGAKSKEHFDYSQFKLNERILNLETQLNMLKGSLMDIVPDIAHIKSRLKDGDVFRKGDQVFYTINKKVAVTPAQLAEIRLKASNQSPYAVINPTDLFGDSTCKQKDQLAPQATSIENLITYRAVINAYFRQCGIDWTKIFDKFSDLEAQFLDIEPDSPQHDIRINPMPKKLQTAVSFSGSDSWSPKVNPKVFLQSMRQRSMPTESLGDKEIDTTVLEKQNTIRKELARNPISCPDFSTISNKTVELDSTSLNDSITSAVDADGLILEGEKVIYYDEENGAQSKIGIVRSLLHYTDCAIVEFDCEQVCTDQDELRFKTCQISQLFPYNLASRAQKDIIGSGFH